MVGRDGLELGAWVERWYGQPVEQTSEDLFNLRARDEADLDRALLLLFPYDPEAGQLNDGTWRQSYEVVLVDSRGVAIVGIRSAAEFLQARIERASQRLH